MVPEIMAFLFVTIILDYIRQTWLSRFTLNWWEIQDFGNDILFLTMLTCFTLRKANITIDNTTVYILPSFMF